MPKSFSDSCLRAKNSTDTQQLQSFAFSTSFNAVSAHILQAKLTEISDTKIKDEVSSFTGANLALASFKEVQYALARYMNTGEEFNAYSPLSGPSGTRFFVNLYDSLLLNYFSYNYKPINA